MDKEKLDGMVAELQLLAAHAASFNNRPMLQNHEQTCGCFHCLRRFPSTEIAEWASDSFGAALCPYCGVDSVLGETSGFPVTEEFLRKMQMRWFKTMSEEN